MSCTSGLASALGNSTFLSENLRQEEKLNLTTNYILFLRELKFRQNLQTACLQAFLQNFSEQVSFRTHESFFRFYKDSMMHISWIMPHPQQDQGQQDSIMKFSKMCTYSPKVGWIKITNCGVIIYGENYLGHQFCSVNSVVNGRPSRDSSMFSIAFQYLSGCFFCVWHMLW